MKKLVLDIMVVVHYYITMNKTNLSLELQLTQNTRDMRKVLSQKYIDFWQRGLVSNRELNHYLFKLYEREFVFSEIARHTETAILDFEKKMAILREGGTKEDLLQAEEVYHDDYMYDAVNYFGE